MTNLIFSILTLLKLPTIIMKEVTESAQTFFESQHQLDCRMLLASLRDEGLGLRSTYLLSACRKQTPAPLQQLNTTIARSINSLSSSFSSNVSRKTVLTRVTRGRGQLPKKTLQRARSDQWLSISRQGLCKLEQSSRQLQHQIQLRKRLAAAVLTLLEKY